MKHGPRSHLAQGKESLHSLFLHFGRMPFSFFAKCVAGLATKCSVRENMVSITSTYTESLSHREPFGTKVRPQQKHIFCLSLVRFCEFTHLLHGACRFHMSCTRRLKCKVYPAAHQPSRVKHVINTHALVEARKRTSASSKFFFLSMCVLNFSLTICMLGN